MLFVILFCHFDIPVVPFRDEMENNLIASANVQLFRNEFRLYVFDIIIDICR